MYELFLFPSHLNLTQTTITQQQQRQYVFRVLLNQITQTQIDRTYVDTRNIFAISKSSTLKMFLSTIISDKKIFSCHGQYFDRELYIIY